MPFTTVYGRALLILHVLDIVGIVAPFQQIHDPCGAGKKSRSISPLSLRFKRACLNVR